MLILQPFRTSPTSQLVLQPFRRFTYVTAHSPTIPLLHLRHSSFSNPSFASPTSQALHLSHLASRPWAPLILQPFRHFTYVKTHSPTLLSLYLRHSSFSNPSVASPTSQFILKPFFRFPYFTNSSLNSPGEPSHYCCPLRQNDVWVTCSEHRGALACAPTADDVHKQELTVQGGST